MNKGEKNWTDRLFLFCPKTAAERLWLLVQDLLEKEIPREYRHLTLQFLRCLVQGQYSKLSAIMRVKFFMVVKNHEVPEDIGPRY